jgi:hypothetical protein
MPTAAHFLYIPAVLLLGVVIGWILGSRAAADAYAVQLRKQEGARARAADQHQGPRTKDQGLGTGAPAP